MPGSSSQHQDHIVLGVTQIYSKALSTMVNLVVDAVLYSQTMYHRLSSVGAVPAVYVSVYLGKASLHMGSCTIGKYHYM